MKDNLDDIWSGGSLKDKPTGPHYDYNVQRMINGYNDDWTDGLISFFKIAGLLLVIVLGFYLYVCGPAMWHNSLVVCNGSNCTTYTDWKVLGENDKSGVLEVWAGGRLQRLSPGTWHYE